MELFHATLIETSSTDSGVYYERPVDDLVVLDEARKLLYCVRQPWNSYNNNNNNNNKNPEIHARSAEQEEKKNRQKVRRVRQPIYYFQVEKPLRLPTKLRLV